MEPTNTAQPNLRRKRIKQPDAWVYYVNCDEKTPVMGKMSDAERRERTKAAAVVLSTEELEAFRDGQLHCGDGKERSNWHSVACLLKTLDHVLDGGTLEACYD